MRKVGLKGLDRPTGWAGVGIVWGPGCGEQNWGTLAKNRLVGSTSVRANSAGRALRGFRLRWVGRPERWKTGGTGTTI